MNRRELILVAFAPALGEPHSPLQIQKLLFLIDRQIPHLVGGPHFQFVPYNYGPFDRTIYGDLAQLAADGLVEIIQNQTWRSYRLSVAGQRQAEALLAGLPANVSDFIKRVSAFVRQLSFAELVTAIYKAYPEMKQNSVFQV
jgi:uncharacterized phage-associated protein